MSNIKIFNVSVTGIREALIRAGYPMQTVVNEDMPDDRTPLEALIRRGNTLGSSPHSHGDDKFLRMIHCDFDVCAPRYWIAEFATYHWTVMNSQSTMHRLTKMDIERQCNSHVDPRIIAVAKEYIDQYKANPSEEALVAMKSNVPEGLRLTVGVSTNYAQLKIMMYQRQDHRLPEWRAFCQWIASLKYAVDLGVTA